MHVYMFDIFDIIAIVDVFCVFVCVRCLHVFVATSLLLNNSLVFKTGSEGQRNFVNPW